MITFLVLEVRSFIRGINTLNINIKYKMAKKLNTYRPSTRGLGSNLKWVTIFYHFFQQFIFYKIKTTTRS